MQYIIGIDPGLTGGLAVITPSGGVVETVTMPEACELVDFFAAYKRSCVDPNDMHVFMEKAQAMPSNGAVSMFNYGEGFGCIQGVLLALEVPYTLVRPQTWTKHIHLGASGDDPKAKSLQVCRRLFPAAEIVPGRTRKPHTGIVDALLIAEFGRRHLFHNAAILERPVTAKVIEFQARDK